MSDYQSPFIGARRNANSRLEAMGMSNGGPVLSPGVKMAMGDVHYTDGAADPSVSCASCVNFEAPGSCSTVAGYINPNGSCDLYQSAAPPDAPAGPGMTPMSPTPTAL